MSEAGKHGWEHSGKIRPSKPNWTTLAGYFSYSIMYRTSFDRASLTFKSAIFPNSVAFLHFLLHCIRHYLIFNSSSDDLL